MYRGAMHCAGLILRGEGVVAFFKGVAAAFYRLGPHFSLTFVFLEQMRRWARVGIVGLE